MGSNYGHCPHCDAAGVMRERRPNGNDTCANGHVYPSSSAVLPPKPTPPPPPPPTSKPAPAQLSPEMLGELRAIQRKLSAYQGIINAIANSVESAEKERSNIEARIEKLLAD